MIVINLLEFLNKAKNLQALEYEQFNDGLVNFLDLMTEDAQFTRKIDLGIIFVCQKCSNEYIIVDGMNRIISLSLLLHAICECYKKTTERNQKAIDTIRKKYIIKNDKAKLKLNENDNIIYNKIINGEKLSGHEKQSPLFILLHDFWSQIKEENLQAVKIFKMLQKINITIVDTENVSKRDLYYKLNTHKRNINQILLIENYLKEKNNIKTWNIVKQKYLKNENDIIDFFNNFFVTKFNYKNFKQERLYEIFTNYYETMLNFQTDDIIIENIQYFAKLYTDIININFKNNDIKNALYRIKKNSGEDTFGYILEVYDDVTQNNISEATFIEILNTIADYLQNRQKSDNNMLFNDLIQYLNAFITCK